MDDRPDPSFDDLDLDLARRIDTVCRRFEADWRQGRHPRIEDFLVEVFEEGRPALQAELDALEHELRQSEEATASARPALTLKRRRSRNSPTAGIPGLLVDGEAKVTLAANFVRHLLRASVRHRSIEHAIWARRSIRPRRKVVVSDC